MLDDDDQPDDGDDPLKQQQPVPEIRLLDEEGRPPQLVQAQANRLSFSEAEMRGLAQQLQINPDLLGESGGDGGRGPGGLPRAAVPAGAARS